MEHVAEVRFDREMGANDAFFVVNGAEVRYLREHAKYRFDQITLIPLSLNAFGAALAAGHERTFDYRSSVDFSACMKDYQQVFPDLSRKWLADMGLRCEIGGIDLADLDAPAQFLFFLHVAQITRLVERLVAEHPHVSRFYAMAGNMPLDFYFDSDVAAAVVRHVCERLGRPVTIIGVSPGPGYMPAPMPAEAEIAEIDPHFVTGKSAPRVGVVTATLRNLDFFVSAFGKSGFDTVLFGSKVWGTPLWDEISETRLSGPIYFSSAPDENDKPTMARLDSLRESVADRMSYGSLPTCIRDNPYLDFQFEHIIKKRWAGYASLIRRASLFVERCPLALLVRSDHFTAEGAVLSHLYRRRGTKVMTAPHSSWPVDINWRSPRHADLALAWSASSAVRLACLDSRATIHTMGEPISSGFKLLYPRQTSKEKLRTVQEAIAGKKVVLLTTNALDVHAVPNTDLVVYFDTCAEVGAVPDRLRERVIVLTRTKPGHFGEDLKLYEHLAGFPESSSVDLSSLDFGECLQIADCVVGVNVPTSGYWEVLQNKIPLIHIQASPAMTLHPDMPQSVIGCDLGVSRIWEELDAVLFNDAYRQSLIARQSAFLEREYDSGSSTDVHPFYEILGGVGRGSVGDRIAATAAGWLTRLGLGRRQAQFGAPPVSVGAIARGINELAPAQTSTAGHVDEVRVSADGQFVAVRGWAAAPGISEPAVRVHAFVDGVYRGVGQTGFDRDDLVAVFNDPNMRKSGYWIRFAPGARFDLSTLEVYGELSDGTFFKVTSPQLSSD